MSYSFKLFLDRTAFAVMSFLILGYASSSGEEFGGKELSVIAAFHNISERISSAQSKMSPDSNIILSPLSIGTILNLFSLGTDGDTKTEIKNALHYPDDLQDSSIHEIYREVFNSLKPEENGVKVSFKTRIFLQKDFSILNSFKAISEISYVTEEENLDFKSFPHSAKERINFWVYENTEGKIKKIISNELSNDTKLVAVNTVFLNATWTFPFRFSPTEKEIFLMGKKEIFVPMMRGDMTVPYLLDENLGLEMISLPFNGDRFSMLILKPLNVRDGNYSKKIDNILETNDLRTLINKMENEKLIAVIPKMKIESEIKLPEKLKSIGINKLFTADADFGGLSFEKGITVSNIVHKALIEITEAGTVADVVTFGPSFRMAVNKFFRLNNPSLLVIRDKKYGLNLLSARLFKPQPIK